MKYFLPLLLLSFPLVAADKSDNVDFYSQLSLDEGINSISLNANVLSSMVESIANSKVGSPTPKYLLKLSQNTKENEDLKSVLFVLYLFASAIEGTEDDAYKVYTQVKLKKTYQDFSPSDPKELLGFSYSWLINNTNLYIKEGFIKSFPDLINNSTPYWGATRDGFFSIETPEGDYFFSTAEYKRFSSTISNMFNPGNCHQGSIVNARYKRHAILNGLITYAPDYYANNISKTKFDSNWVDFWRYAGEFEWARYNEYIEAKNNWRISFIRQISKTHSINLKKAEILAEDHINRMFNIYFNTSYEDIEKTLMNYDMKGLTSGEISYLSSFEKLILGGYILREHTENKLIEYFTVINEIGDQSTANELFNQVVASNKYSMNIYLEFVNNKDNSWGYFNKTPLMYAAQYDNLEAYQLLTSSNIQRINVSGLELTESESSCESPNIGNRTILTYALENSGKLLIDNVVSDFGNKLSFLMDSEDRSVVYYLSQNPKLNNSERNKVLNKLYIKGAIEYAASFNCKKAQTKIEVLTCGTKDNAEVDKKMGTTYKSAMLITSNDEERFKLKDTQRKWLKSRETCIKGYHSNGFYRCYENRIEAIQKQYLSE